MKIKIKTRQFRNWDKATQTKLKRLTLREGELRYVIQGKPESQTWVAFEDGEPVAWLACIHTDVYHRTSWACPSTTRTESDLMFYTRRSHRRQGLGTRLYKIAMRWKRKHDRSKTTVYADPENRAFFRSIGRRDAGRDHWEREGLDY